MSDTALETEWRRTPWDKKFEFRQKLRDFKPANPQVKRVRILLYGPIGAGKSSFINSINNIFQDKMTNVALVDAASAGQSFTTKFQTHCIERSYYENFYPFVFNDIMGLEPKQGKGADQEDIISALAGRVKEGYTFKPGAPLGPTDDYYNPSPSAEDMVHCLVCIINTGAVARVTDDILAKMRQIRKEASSLGIPQMAILTHVDMACPLVRADLRNIYKSKYIKNKMEEFSNKLGIPVNCIFPLKNYHEEIDLDDDIDVLILRALKQMIDFADDFIKKLPDVPSGKMATGKADQCQKLPVIV